MTSKCLIHSEAAIDMILAWDKNMACQNRYAQTAMQANKIAKHFFCLFKFHSNYVFKYCLVNNNACLTHVTNVLLHPTVKNKILSFSKLEAKV